MNNNMMWAYLIHLSMNMWGDSRGTKPHPQYHNSLSECLDEEIWKKTIDFLPSQGINTVLIDVGDAIQYETHPEISTPGAWSKDKLKAELDRIRSLGLTPYPKLNFSTGHDAWLGIYSYMVSTPQYYQVCKDLIGEVAEVFGYPELFHLGMDEENQTMQRRNEYCVIRQGDLWWHDSYFFYDCCEKLGMRPWVWADMVWERREEYISRMPKSVLQSNWYYYQMYADKNPDGSYVCPYYEAYRVLDKAGFDQVLTGSTVSYRNNLELTMRIAKEDIAPERLKGVMTTPWVSTIELNQYDLFSDARHFRDGKEKVFPEFCK